MVDGTKVELQERGTSLGNKDMRWALASENVGVRFSRSAYPKLMAQAASDLGIGLFVTSLFNAALHH
jgi:hypothetical protein